MKLSTMAVREPGFGTSCAVAMEQSMLHLKRLRVSEFRSVASADLALGTGAIVLIGPNGAGKTNILEAISFLAPGRGMLQSKLSDVTRRGSNSGSLWAVSADVANGESTWRIGTGLSKDSLGRDRRQFRLEGESAGGADIGEIVRLVWLTPALERLFEDSASVRRKFFDRLVASIEPGHTTHLSKYERAMSERLRLLKEESRDVEWLQSLEAIAATEGAAIAAARLRVLQALTDSIAAGGPWSDALFPRAALGLDGTVEADLATMSEAAAEGRLRESLERNRARDAVAGKNLVGPQRSDLKVSHAQRDLPAELSSTGEQKALLLNILLAHVRLVREQHGAAPIVLLDEVAAHLDADRRSALLSALTLFGAQMFLSGTDERTFADLPSPQIFRFERGLVRSSTIPASR